jgi:indole-3-glycerol phosphate synthase
MQSLAKESLSLGLDIIVEVHNESELVRAVDLIQALAKTYPEVATKVALGINNRDLHSFVTDLSVTIKLISHAKAKLFTEESKIKFSDICWISESGLGSAADLCHLKQSGVKNFLIGESLIKSGAPGEALSLLIEQASK